MNKEILKRYERNALITVDDVPYSCKRVYNPGAVKFKGEYLLLLRTDTDIPLGSCLGLAVSKDGYNFHVEKEPVMVANKEEGAIYDPRITQIGETYYIFYATDSSSGIQLGLASTRDFHTFDRVSLSEPDLRNGVLFPEKIGGYYVRLDRPFPLYSDPLRGFDIWISYSPDLVFWGRSKLLLAAKDCSWGKNKIGPGAVPIKTKEGWLIIFHGVEIDDRVKGWNKIYRLGCALLELEDPSKVKGVYKNPILEPRDKYEINGYRPNAIFTCGAITEENGEVKIYYGAADQCIAVATAKLKDLVSSCVQKV